MCRHGHSVHMYTDLSKDREKKSKEGRPIKGLDLGTTYRVILNVEVLKLKFSFPKERRST